ncbi:MAG TPA: FHA domain-containing serine/threonine-protein kinase [Gemmataceae bacterium]|nr:FHA domain-containing serine/threonine-protein kinase [Gemmataceae bacterium]
MSLQLLVIAGPDKGRAFTLQSGPNLMLGRSAQAYYQLNDPRVSRNHCQVINDGDAVSVVCNGGSGGTLVNGKAVKQQALKVGDVLQLGDTQLRLQVGDLPLDVALAHAPSAPAAPAKTPERLESLSGQTLGHYDIGPVIGRGSSCLVFHATDTKNNQPVAFKVLLPEFSRDEEEMQRFVRAIKTVLPLRHPNLISCYSAGKTGPYCWVAMEYVAGENMKQVIDRIGVAGMLDWRYAFKVAVHVARALKYAHEQNILHRNVTPTNILLDAPTKVVKLGDLMLAKALEGGAQITKPGELVGDIVYMSPERTRGIPDEIDARSDLYGLGATVYALLAGRPPFTGATLAEKVTRIRQTEPERPTKYQMSIPGQFEGVVMKLLAKRPEDRYQTAADLLREVERVAKFSGVTV